MIKKPRYCKYCGKPLGVGQPGPYCGQKCKEQSPEGRVKATLIFLAVFGAAALWCYLAFVVKAFE